MSNKNLEKKIINPGFGTKKRRLLIIPSSGEDAVANIFFYSARYNDCLPEITAFLKLQPLKLDFLLERD